MSMQGVKLGKKSDGSVWTNQDHAYALMIAMLNLLGPGLTKFQHLKASGETGEAKWHANHVMELCLKLWNNPSELVRAANYMAEDLGFTVESVAVAQNSSEVPN